MPEFADIGEAMEGKQRRRLAHNQVSEVMVPDTVGYNHIANRARAVFSERNEKRKSAFRQAGWKGQLVEMRKKLDRLWAVWGERSPEPKDIDEALDLINAAIFFIMLAEEDEPNGRWPWP
ncbi:MAG TPA: hypothetical protein VNS88_10190 [Nitrospiraceae bacterium]|nr:hypothetical protein [Nitrospiraceae bacterium]